MNLNIKIETALISVYNKNEKIKNIIKKLSNNKVNLISTGGTQKYIESLGYQATPVENLTNYPSLFDGRLKTLHPSILGSLLYRRDIETDCKEAEKYNIKKIDLVIVDLYPFEETLKQTTNNEEIIEKIDIGGITLIRAAAKNYKHVLVIPSQDYYDFLINILDNQNAISTLDDRYKMATYSFQVTSTYDRLIYQYFSGSPIFEVPLHPVNQLRYGENPHQKGWFIGNFYEILKKEQGKDLSYNNIIDIDAALNLILEFDEPTTAIIKHTNPCGVATSNNHIEAWQKALNSDPVSAFGGIIICNFPISVEIAKEINSIFYEILIAPYFHNDALEILKQKSKRILLTYNNKLTNKYQVRTALNGILIQEKNLHRTTKDILKVVTNKAPSQEEIDDLIFANKIVKHSKSNAIAIVKNKQLLGIGIGETSRVDAVKHAIEKAKNFNKDLIGAVLASDAFFPFVDNLEIAYKAGIKAIIQPGGSIRDQECIDFCNQKNLSMIFTNFRHFKH